MEEHTNEGLRKAIFMLKKKQTKGKKLNIFGEELARPLLVSSKKLSHLKEDLATKEAAKEKEEEEKEERKI